MADEGNVIYVNGINIGGIIKKINYEELANLPNLDEKQPTLSDTDGGYGQRIKAIEDALANAIDFDTQTY